MYKQIRIEEKAHFYIEDQTNVELYRKIKESQGYKTKIEVSSPKGWIVSSTIWIALN